MIVNNKVLKEFILKGYCRIASLKGRVQASYIFKDAPYKAEGASSRIAQHKSSGKALGWGYY
jgi:hypothetical protein